MDQAKSEKKETAKLFFPSPRIKRMKSSRRVLH